MFVMVCGKIGERRLNVITVKQFRSTGHYLVKKILRVVMSHTNTTLSPDLKWRVYRQV